MMASKLEVEVRVLESQQKYVKCMKGFSYVYGKTLAQALMAANDAGVKKEDFVTLFEEGGVVCLVYYAN